VEVAFPVQPVLDGAGGSGAMPGEEAETKGRGREDFFFR